MIRPTTFTPNQRACMISAVKDAAQKYWGDGIEERPNNVIDSVELTLDDGREVTLESECEFLMEEWDDEYVDDVETNWGVPYVCAGSHYLPSAIGNIKVNWYADEAQTIEREEVLELTDKESKI